MRQNRREFLLGTVWMGAAAMAAGCISKGSALCGIGNGAGAPMHGFTVPPMKKVRVGFIGVGGRGIAAVETQLSLTPKLLQLTMTQPCFLLSQSSCRPLTAACTQTV